MNEVSAQNLTVHLGASRVLDDLSFSVERGELVALVGPNGSGKTTLLRTIAGMLPFEGTVEVGGKPVDSWSARDRARRMAFVRQAQSIDFDFSVLEFVLLGRTAHRGWLEPFGQSDRDRALAALAEVDMGSFAERSVTRLSGGEQQRVRLAQALAQEASLLLLDEPTAHLDVHHQLDLMGRMRDLVDGGRTLIAALHDLPMAARFADRLLVLDRGRLAAVGLPADVLQTRLLEDVFRVRAVIDDGDPSTLRYLSPA